MTDMLAKTYHLLTRDSYLSDRQIYELKYKEFRQVLEAEKSDISCGQFFDYGKVIYFTWKKDRLTERQAVSNAKTQLLLERAWDVQRYKIKAKKGRVGNETKRGRTASWY